MEDPVEFVDAHVHLWDLTTGWYPALVSDSRTHLKRPGIGDVSKIQNTNFLLDDYFRHAQRAENINVTKMVHITAAQAPPTWPDETRFLQSMFETRAYPDAIIGWTSFDQPLADLDRELGAHAESANFRGVRHQAGIDYLSDHVADCFAVLQKRGLIYDTVAHEQDLPAAAAVARRFDDMTFILEHTGWPTSADSKTFRHWRDGIELFAQSPNTGVKISGLGMAIHDWTAEDFRPWVEATIETFGTERCMFATNFPVDWLYSEYDTLLNAFLALTSGFSSSERASLFAQNAERLYRI